MCRNSCYYRRIVMLAVLGKRFNKKGFLYYIFGAPKSLFNFISIHTIHRIWVWRRESNLDHRSIYLAPKPIELQTSPIIRKDWLTLKLARHPSLIYPPAANFPQLSAPDLSRPNQLTEFYWMFFLSLLNRKVENSHTYNVSFHGLYINHDQFWTRPGPSFSNKL